MWSIVHILNENSFFSGFCLLKTINLDRAKLKKRDWCLVVVALVYITVGIFIFGETTTLAIQTDIKPRTIM